MALRDQPYLPLYVQDFLTDERLNECSAESTGVYIRLMCLMHKSQEYGTIRLKQKDKQSGEAAKDFAVKLARQMPYAADVIERSLRELLEEEVLSLDGDQLFQRRMVKDGRLSSIRQEARKQRRDKVQTDSEDFVEEFVSGFVPTKPATNAEYETESETDTESEGEYENETGVDNPPARLRAPAPPREQEDIVWLHAYSCYLGNVSLILGTEGRDELKRFCKVLPENVILRAIEPGPDWPAIRDRLQRIEKQMGEKKT